MSDEQGQRGERDDFERLRPAGDEPADLGREARHAERVEEGAVELRPRGVGEVLDLGLDLVRSRFGMCVALAAVVWLPIQQLLVLLPLPDVTKGRPYDPDWWLNFWARSLWVNAIVSIGSLLVVGIVARIVGDAIEGRRTSAGRALRAAVTKLPGLIVILVLTVAAVIVGLCLLLVPGLIALWVLAPAPYVYVIEDVGLSTAIRRSVDISTNRIVSWTGFYSFWRWAGVAFVGFMLLLPLTLLVGAPERPDVHAWLLHTLHLSEPVLAALRVILGGVILAATTTVRAGYYTAYYLDCRVRREGLDLETWLRRIRGEDKIAVEKGALTT